jgi:hypothetical protein
VDWGCYWKRTKDSACVAIRSSALTPIYRYSQAIITLRGFCEKKTGERTAGVVLSSEVWLQNAFQALGLHTDGPD